MLAAHTTTGDWIAGIVVLVIGLAIIIGMVWLIYRLVTWPFRRRRGSPSGLGSDYEQMIRQQPRDRRVPSGGSEPFPPPGGWQPPPQPSRVVMPPAGYRPRRPELPEPDLSAGVPTPATFVLEQPTPEPSSWSRLMRKTFRIPGWLTLSLAWLGSAFVLLLRAAGCRLGALGKRDDSLPPPVVVTPVGEGTTAPTETPTRPAQTTSTQPGARW